MKVQAKQPKLLYTRNHQAELTMTIDNRQQISWLEGLDFDKVYNVEIKEVKSKRSLQQNAFLWKLLHELEKVTHEPAMDWYIKALIETGAVVDYIWVAERVEDKIKKMFRALTREKYEKQKNVEGHWCRVIVGSSKFNVQEMNRLLDTVLRYCHEHEIETEMFNYE